MAARTIQPAFAEFDSYPNSALIDVRVIANLYGCSPNTIWRWAAAGVIPKPIKVSSQQTRWRVGDVRQALASLSVPGRCEQ